MNFQHASLASGRWFSMTLAEQLGNIGSEVHRARLAEGKHPARFDAAVDRALELFDLTLADTRWKGRRFELGRVRAVLADAFLGGGEFASTLAGLEPYFDRFALLAARSAR
jgi:hypothetical protein